MAKDNGKRFRWSDKDSKVEDESADAGAVRRHVTDIDRLARDEMRSGEENLRLGQRENSEEIAVQMQAEVRDRIAAIEAEFNPEDPRLAPFKVQKVQFEEATSEVTQGRAWEEVVAAMKKGGQFNSVDEFLAATSNLENAKIYFIHDHELLIGDGNPEVPEETLGMDYFVAAKHCADLGLDMLTKAEWEKLQTVYGATEQQSITWCKTEQELLNNNPSLAWGARHGYVFQYLAYGGRRYRGVRRVLRVNLTFES